MKIDVKQILRENFNDQILKIYSCKQAYNKYMTFQNILESKISANVIVDFYKLDELFGAYYDLIENEFDNFLFDFLAKMF